MAHKHSHESEDISVTCGVKTVFHIRYDTLKVYVHQSRTLKQKDL